MAITTNTFTLSSGFARTDCIEQLEDAFAWAGFHGAALSGIVTGISAYTGGGSGTSSDYYDVRPSTSSRAVGTANTVSFRVDRSGGSVDRIYVNRPGAGYQDGDTFTLSTADTGGDVAIGITVLVDETSYGSASSFYVKRNTAGATNPFGVLRLPVEASKVYGDSYFAFQMQDDNTLAIYGGSSFMPYEGTNNSFDDKSSGAKTRFAGDEYLDIEAFATPVTGASMDPNSQFGQNKLNTIIDICTDNSRDLELTAFKSGEDTNFVVFAYRVPTQNTSYFTGRNFGCFFLHNFTTSLYDHDYVYCGGMTSIEAQSNSSASIQFVTSIAPFDFSGSSNSIAKRSGLAGFAGHNNSSDANTSYTDSYEAMTYDSEKSATQDSVFYYRNNALGFSANTQNASGTKLDDNANYNAVIKGIPVCTKFIPVPYYLPDDFVLINFDYATPNTLVDQWDTITISGSEVYTVISASYNQTTRTRGIAFCARTT